MAIIHSKRVQCPIQLALSYDVENKYWTVVDDALLEN